MKNRKLLKLLAAILCVSTLLVTLSACATGTQKDKKNAVKKLYNLKWELDTSIPTSVKNLGVSGIVTDYNENLMVFVDDTDDGTVTQVYSHLTGTVLFRETGREPVVYFAYLPSGTENLYAVVKATLAAEIDELVSPFAEISLSVYDAKGTAVKTFTKEELTSSIEDILEKDYPTWQLSSQFEDILDALLGDKISSVCDGYFMLDKTVYAENEDGTVTAVKEFKFSSAPDVDYEYEGYFYYFDDEEILAYNDKLELTARYTVPSFAKSTDIYMLNNGNILVQYRVILPEDAAAYDLWDKETKYDLVTEILSVKDDTVKKVDAKYVIQNITPRDQDAELEDYLSKKLDNLATVSFIDENKMIDQNDSALEYVLLDNEGGIDAFLTNDKWQGLPIMLRKDLFYVSSLGGDIELFNSKGETLCVMDFGMEMICGYQYITDGEIVYDLTGAEVYNLKANDMKLWSDRGTCAFFVKQEETLTTYYRFANGAVTEIAKVGGEGATARDVEFGYAYYYVQNAETEKYAYYNYEGTLLCEVTSELDRVAEWEDGVVLIDEDGAYYLFLYQQTEEK